MQVTAIVLKVPPDLYFEKLNKFKELYSEHLYTY